MKAAKCVALLNNGIARTTSMIFFCLNQQYDIIDNPAHICLSVKDSKIHSYQTYGTFYASYHAIRSNS